MKYKVNERPDQLAFIVPTHGHYDHLGGAEDLPGVPILLSPAEIQFLDRELQTPDIVAASNSRALRSRLRTITFSDAERVGFSESFDLFGDGSVIVVPLPGHTPGSVGVLASVGGHRCCCSVMWCSCSRRQRKVWRRLVRCAQWSMTTVRLQTRRPGHLLNFTPSIRRLR